MVVPVHNQFRPYPRQHLNQVGPVAQIPILRGPMHDGRVMNGQHAKARAHLGRGQQVLQPSQLGLAHPTPRA